MVIFPEICMVTLTKAKHCIPNYSMFFFFLLRNIRKKIIISGMENELCATIHVSVIAYITNKALEMPLELVLQVTLTLSRFSVFLLKLETSLYRKYKLKGNWCYRSTDWKFKHLDLLNVMMCQNFWINLLKLGFEIK